MATKRLKNKKKFTIERADRLQKIAEIAGLAVERTHENALLIEEGEIGLELAVHGKKVDVTFGPVNESQAAKVLTSVKLVDAFLKAYK